MAGRDLARGPPGQGLQLLAGPGHADPEEPHPGRPACGADLRAGRGRTGGRPGAAAVRRPNAGPGRLPHRSQRASSPQAAQAKRRARPVRLSTHTTRRSVRTARPAARSRAQARVVRAAVDDLEGRPALAFGAPVDHPERTGGEEFHGGTGADDHARDAGPPCPLRRDRDCVPGRSLLLPETFVVAVDDDHGRQSRAGRPRCGPGPTTTAAPARAWAQSSGTTATSPPARRSRPASTLPRLADGTTTRVGPRWASSATSGVASAAGGSRTMTGRSTGRPSSRPVERGGAGGRRAGAGNAGTATSADAGFEQGAAPAGPAPGGPAGQVHHLGFGAPAPYLGDGPQGQAWCGFNTDLHNPAADPPPGEVEAHLRADPHGPPGRWAPGNQTLCRSQPRR